MTESLPINRVGPSTEIKKSQTQLGQYPAPTLSSFAMQSNMQKPMPLPTHLWKLNDIQRDTKKAIMNLSSQKNSQRTNNTKAESTRNRFKLELSDKVFGTFDREDNKTKIDLKQTQRTGFSQTLFSEGKSTYATSGFRNRFNEDSGFALRNSPKSLIKQLTPRQQEELGEMQLKIDKTSLYATGFVQRQQTPTGHRQEYHDKSSQLQFGFNSIVSGGGTASGFETGLPCIRRQDKLTLDQEKSHFYLSSALGPTRNRVFAARSEMQHSDRTVPIITTSVLEAGKVSDFRDLIKRKLLSKSTLHNKFEHSERIKQATVGQSEQSPPQSFKKQTDQQKETKTKQNKVTTDPKGDDANEEIKESSYDQEKRLRKLLKKIQTNPVNKVNPLLLTCFNTEFKQFVQMQSPRFKQTFDVNTLLQAQCSVNQPFLSRLRTTKRQRMGFQLTQAEQHDLAFFTHAQGFNLHDNSLLDEDLIAAQIFRPIKQVAKKVSKVQKPLDGNDTITFGGEASNQGRSGEQSGGKTGKYPSKDIKSPFSKSPIHSMKKFQTSPRAIKRKDSRRNYDTFATEVSEEEEPVLVQTASQMLESIKPRVQEQLRKAEKRESVMAGKSFHQGEVNQDSEAQLETMKEVVEQMQENETENYIKEITAGQDWISQEELEALLMFKELKQGMNKPAIEWDQQLIQRGLNVKFSKGQDDDELVHFLQQRHNRYRSLQGQLVVERQLYLLEKIIQHDQMKLMTINEEIKQKLFYMRLYKGQTGASMHELHKEDPKVKFFVECRKSLDLALPLLDRILGKTLCLKDYKLNSGLCKALALACSLFDHSVNRIFFDNCGIQDNEFAQILQGVSHHDDFKSIVYIRNGFGQQSLDALKPLFKKKIPFHLNEVRIANCKISIGIYSQLLQTINQKSYLRSLALIQAQLSEECFTHLISFMKTSSTLCELNLSWCDATSNSWLRFFEALKVNRKLVTLNLSYNSIFDTKTESQTVPAITHFIKRNKCLVHMNLTATSLQSSSLLKVGQALRRSCSLQAIHLCENPGLDDDTIFQVQQHIRGKLADPVVRIVPGDKDVMSFEVKEQHPKALLDAEYVNEMAQLRNMNKLHVKMPTSEDRKLIISRKLGFKKITPGLGQWQLMSGLKDECWICEQHVCAVFLWSEQIGEQDNINDFVLEEFFEEEIEQVNLDIDSLPISLPNRENSLTRSDRLKQKSEASKLLPKLGKLKKRSSIIKPMPDIYGEFSHWKPKQMFEVDDLCTLILGSNHEELVQILSEKRLIKNIENALKGYLHMTKEEKRAYVQLMRVQQNIPKKPWHQILLESIPYANPLVVNAEASYAEWRLSENQAVYAYVDFIRPGKYYYAVNFKAEQSVHRVLARHRQESVPSYKREPQVQQRFFVKSGSVFANFQDDTAEIYESCFDYDAKSWKIAKLIKDKTDQEECEYLINEKYPNLMQIYQTMRGVFGNNYSIPCSGFKRMCNEMKIMRTANTQKRESEILLLTNTDIERFLLAANYQERDSNAQALEFGHKEKLDEEILKEDVAYRSHFIEMLIRIAKHRYCITKRCKTVSEAFKKLMDDIILPFYYREFTIWQNFRQQFLWSMDCDDLFKANKDEVQKLWEKYSAIMSPKKKYCLSALKLSEDVIVLEDCYQMIIDDAAIDIDKNDVKIAFQLSKQTVIKDADEKGMITLSRMVVCEFYEFIGRIAVLKFHNSEMAEISLADKICSVLDDLFVIINKTRKAIGVEEDVSASDEDY